MRDGIRLKMAVVGTGISGLSAAWLLSQRHDVTVYEQAERIGGHSNTVVHRRRRKIPVDTGFIVFNRQAYPNLTALFAHLGVPTQASEMSLRRVAAMTAMLEYSGTGLRGPVRPAAQPVPSALLVDAARSRRASTGRRRGDAAAVRRTKPSASATISARAATATRSATIICCRWPARSGRRRRARCWHYPAAAFIRFHRQSRPAAADASVPPGRPWSAAARAYVERLIAALRRPDQARHQRSSRVRRGADGVIVDGRRTANRTATTMSSWPAHADQALVGARRSEPGGDANCSARSATAATWPCCTRTRVSCRKRRAVWSSWNYIGSRDATRTVSA